VRPSDEEIDESIERMLKLFFEKGFPETIIHQLEDDDINVECAAHPDTINKLASCIGGDEWGWIPIAFANSETDSKYFE
jgi:hypothetical protein